jgi:hypothetical protein
MAETAIISLSSFGPGRVFQYFWLGFNMVRNVIESGCELAKESKMFSEAGELHLYICMFGWPPPRVLSVYSAGLGGNVERAGGNLGGSPSQVSPWAKPIDRILSTRGAETLWGHLDVFVSNSQSR